MKISAKIIPVTYVHKKRPALRDASQEQIVLRISGAVAAQRQKVATKS